MLCEQCKVRRAEIQLVNLINGESRVQHLCRECASAHLKLDDAANLMKLSFSVEGLMGIEEAFRDLVMPALREAQKEKKKMRVCPHCGGILPNSMFENDREAVREELTEKRPPETEEKIMTAEDELSELNAKMSEAVKEENYEYAARLRDRIAELKKSAYESGS
ncbi:MAG: UvrB/UvrC motif-containing protein [Synergistaceae bacterium]|nr:UvrB/UvrC motif-containing protein [Synergistaceae bacterium]